MGRNQSWSGLAYWTQNWSVITSEHKKPEGLRVIVLLGRVVSSKSDERPPAHLPGSTESTTRLGESFPKAFHFICLCSFSWSSLQLYSLKHGLCGSYWGGRAGERAGGFICVLLAESCCNIAQKMKSVTIVYLQVISRSSIICSRWLLCFCENVFLKQLVK